MPTEDTPPSGNHPLDQSPEQRTYNPSGFPEDRPPHASLQNNINVAEGSHDHIRNSSGNGLSALGEVGHVTAGGGFGDGESRGQRWSQNEPQTMFTDHEGNGNVPKSDLVSSADIGSHGDQTHAVHLPAQGETTYNNSPPESGVAAKGLETDQSHSLPKPTPAATTLTNQGEVVPVIKGTKEPMALSSFKRHMCETYSSDDDDVFLPNPPSKSQADKCIVSMDTEEEGEDRGVAAASLQAPQIVVTLEREEEGEGEGVEPQLQAPEDDSATGTVTIVL